MEFFKIYILIITEPVTITVTNNNSFLVTLFFSIKYEKIIVNKRDVFSIGTTAPASAIPNAPKKQNQPSAVQTADKNINTSSFLGIFATSEIIPLNNNKENEIITTIKVLIAVADTTSTPSAPNFEQTEDNAENKAAKKAVQNQPFVCLDFSKNSNKTMPDNKINPPITFKKSRCDSPSNKNASNTVMTAELFSVAATHSASALDNALK